MKTYSLVSIGQKGRFAEKQLVATRVERTVSNSIIIVYIMGMFFSTLLTGSRVFASAPSCGVSEAVSAFQVAVADAVKQMPALDADVDLCFNPGRPEYIVQTHKTLHAIFSEYTAAQGELARAYQDFEAGRTTGFVSEIAKLVPTLNQVNRPLLNNAGSLKNYGFTTSDALRNGRPLYPSCNSKMNDQPAQRWAQTYGDIMALRRAVGALKEAAECLDPSS